MLAAVFVGMFRPAKAPAALRPAPEWKRLMIVTTIDRERHIVRVCPPDKVEPSEEVSLSPKSVEKLEASGYLTARMVVLFGPLADDIEIVRKLGAPILWAGDHIGGISGTVNRSEGTDK